MAATLEQLLSCGEFRRVAPTWGAVTFATSSSRGPIPDLLHKVHCALKSAWPNPLVQVGPTQHFVHCLPSQTSRLPDLSSG